MTQKPKIIKEIGLKLEPYIEEFSDSKYTQFHAVRAWTGKKFEEDGSSYKPYYALGYIAYYKPIMAYLYFPNDEANKIDRDGDYIYEIFSINNAAMQLTKAFLGKEIK